MKTISIRSLLNIFYILFICLSCQNSQPLSAYTKMDHSKDSLKTNFFTMPDGIQVYTPFGNYLLDSARLQERSSFKIYSYINGSCPSCIEDITKWRDVVPEFMKFNVPVILIFHSKDNFELIKYLCESKKIEPFPFPFFLDYKEQFYKQNTFLKEFDSEKATLLVDKTNKIVVMGNPLHSKKIKEQYYLELKGG